MMMTSNVLSRFLPPATGEPSIYEILRQQDHSDHPDIEERAAITTDEDNFATGFHDYDVSDSVIDSSASHIDHSGNEVKDRPDTGPFAQELQNRMQKSQQARRIDTDELDDEVPQSLLIEEDGHSTPNPVEQHHSMRSPPGVGLAGRGVRAKWQTAQQQQQLHLDAIPPQTQSVGRGQPVIMDPKERALWMWANVENLDNFLWEIYEYFIGRGIWSITLTSVLNLFTFAFVITFTAFLSSCIDYKKIPQSKTMSQILVPKCAQKWSLSMNVIIWLLVIFWISRMFGLVNRFRRLRAIQMFYRHLLDISDSEIKTVEWQYIVKKLMDLRDLNPTTAGVVKERHRYFLGTQSKQRMDAHDIANRLMRRDNYMIAMINKDVLNMTLPIPFLGNRQLFSQTLQWNLSYTILDHVFDDNGQIRPLFLKDTYRRALSDSMARRFKFAAFINAVCAPFLLIFFVLWYFFRYFNEYQKNPSQIGSRQYTPLAKWKFRQFNELEHFFERRTNMSYPFASRYLDQFPKHNTAQLANFVAFVTGAIASVLALASLIDPESFLAFEITPERTVLFYLGVFGSVWAVARAVVPEEHMVFDPAYALSEVITYTQYEPSHWRDRLQSDEIRAEFAQLYKMKLLIFFEELISISLTPLVLWCVLPSCSDRIVDFFREFTLHVDGLGYVCSFAVFDFKNGGNKAAPVTSGAEQGLRDDYFSAKDGKGAASYYGFMNQYGFEYGRGPQFHHLESRQPFHAPPAFPGLTSSNMDVNVHGQGMAKSGRAERDAGMPNRSLLAGPQTRNRSVQSRTPRFGPTAGLSSPMASVLLDPHHQPSQTTRRSQRRFGAQSRPRASHRPLEDQFEDDEAVIETVPRLDEASGEGQESAELLGESWKTTRAGNRDEDGDEDALATSKDKDPGVLGLVYQYSKAQTDGKRAGVNI